MFDPAVDRYIDCLDSALISDERRPGMAVVIRTLCSEARSDGSPCSEFRCSE